MSRVAAALVLLFGLVGPATVGAAQEPLSANDFTIDLVQGPVLGSGRIIGLGGAYTAISDGVDGAPWNPAAYGSRTLWELDWFEWEIALGILFPGAFSRNDFWNTGRAEGLRVKDFTAVTLGLRLQFGRLGIGGLARVHQYRPAPDVTATFVVGNYGYGYQLFDGQLVLGFGARTVDFSVRDEATLTDLVQFNGTGPELGVVLRIADQPWRMGAAARLPVRSREINGSGVEELGGVQRAGEFVLPREVYMPWEVQVGFAWQLGRRPLNRKWQNPHEQELGVRLALDQRQWEREQAQVARERAARPTSTTEDPYAWLPSRAQAPEFWARERALREQEEEEFDAAVEEEEAAQEAELRAMSRRYILLTGEVLITGPSPDGVGVEGFLAQERERSGQNATVGLRLGAEGEPWRNRLKVRAGTYLEPSRFADVGYRVHGTGGFDLRLFTWDLFGLFDDFDLRVSATVDVAVRYFDWGVGVGFWH